MKKLMDMSMAVVFWIVEAFVWAIVLAIALLWDTTVERHKRIGVKRTRSDSLAKRSVIVLIYSQRSTAI